MGLGKPKKSLLSPAEEQVVKKMSKKELGKSIHGNPDEWDRKNLEVLINSYEQAHPGRLTKMASDYKVERALSTRNDYGVVSEQSNARFVMWMPEDLQKVIQKGYPSIWTNERHLHWFLKRFPIFRASEKL